MTPEQEARLRKEREERVREERIRLRALEIWREQGRPDGRAREHWEKQSVRWAAITAVKPAAIARPVKLY